MKSWKDISLFKYQQVDDIMSKKDIDDIDKTLYCICVVFDITHHQLNNSNPRRAIRLTKKIDKIFSEKIEPVVSKRFGRYVIEFDINKLTYGQYLELSFFASNDITRNGHLILASVSHTMFCKIKADDHYKKSQYFLEQPIHKVLGTLVQIVNNLNAFNVKHKRLFGLDEDDDDSGEIDWFTKRYGWQYSATQVADHEKITLDEAYGLPVNQAFQDLAYLKAKSKYEKSLLKKK